MRQWVWIGGLVLALAFGGCGSEEGEDGDAAAPAAPPAPPAETTETTETGSSADMSTPRGSIEHQHALLKAGDLEAFKACFTPRLQNGITAEAMAQGAKEVGSMSLDDLFASMVEGEYEGKQTAKVKMKNGRTLTTLILTDGKWLADTIWFR